MKVLKGYTKNQYKPKTSNVERYVAEESIEFCLEFNEIMKPIGLPHSHHDMR